MKELKISLNINMPEIIVRVRLQQSVQMKMPAIVVLVIDNCMSTILERVDSPLDDFFNLLLFYFYKVIKRKKL